ncbi:CD3072 family TudS-related putative desulfidase [Tissierella sp.]|uniref:CD3072 family TudS-related putative desulfidase n=1 Tax=Tissierella sp. TaxID=41274 RepID=UPI0028ABE841|nr:CD3072 family TudS-related putative desulfidase [Tissierella sp.]
MERSKRVVFISHCILNQNTVVYPLARAKGAYKEIIQEIVSKGIGIHQLPCPEYRHLGLKRKPMDKLEYDTKEYRSLCKHISQDTINMMKEYLENDCKVIGLIGINESPTCSIGGIKGILMEELIVLAEKEQIVLNTLDVPEEYFDGKDNEKFIKELREFIKN